MERRLTAILVADVVGYTRLMGADEVGTLRRIKAQREALLKPLISEHSGRIVKLMGDGLLIEFASMVDAVTCAVAWQEGVAKMEAEHGEATRMQYRIGVNLGDIIVDDGDIYGDGVNIAARLEGLAEPGGVCISGDAYRQVSGKIDARFEDLGEQQVKNVIEPVRVYRVASNRSLAAGKTPTSPTIKDTADTAPAEFPNLAGASGPSVAVLPLKNLSADPDQEFFADGLSEEIIFALSASRSFPILASSSTFAYKGRAVDAHTAGNELGARYVLDGSVRRSGNRLRVSVELVDVDTRIQLWSERYERPMDDLFTVQDDITTTVAAIVEPEIDAQEMKRLLVAQPSINMNAYEFAQRGFWHLWKNTFEDYQSSCPQFEASLHADPRYARAYAGMTQGKYFAGVRLWEDRQTALEEAIQLGSAALDLDGRDPRALRYFGGAHLFLGRYDEALRALRRAIVVQPSYAVAYSGLAFALDFVGDFEDAVTAEETTARLRPGDRSLHVCTLSKAIATYQLNDYEIAEAVCRESLRINDQFWMSNLMLAASLGQRGKIEEAKAAATRVDQLLPSLTEEGLSKLLPFRERGHLDNIVDGLRKAGMKFS